MHKLLQIITCRKSPKDRDYNKIERFIHDSLAEAKYSQDTTPNPVKDIEVYGYSQIGYGPGKSECQDSYSIIPKLTSNIHFVAVYDGHGIKGREVSLYVNDHLTKCLKRNSSSIEKLARKDQIEEFLKEVFRIIERKLNDSLINTSVSGTCCIALLISKGKCYVANVGDSRAVLCRTGPGGETITMELSQDHKPTRDDEKERIIKMGGVIEPMYVDGTAFGPLRVWNKAKTTGMAMTRTMGDLRGKQAGIIAEPEILKFDLQTEDKFIIVASDGLWDVMTSEEAVEFVLKYLEEGKPKSNAVRALAREARKRWENLEDDDDDGPYCDDTTIVIAFPEFYGYT